MRKTFASLLLAVFTACATTSPAVAPAQPAAAPQSWADGAVFYEVFVRSFQDSNGDGSGDLKGLVSRLDYLKDLGVDAIWLMPVFDSPSYHGYDTTDYEKINPDYGTNDDFAVLLREAHARNIRVIVDLVLNHTSSRHPWFEESASSPSSPKRDWYVWSPTRLDWGQPWNPAGKTWHEKNGAYYYGLFWAGMPDLNFRTPAVREEMKRVAGLWLKRGVDGFRLDAVRHLIETGPGETGQNDTAESHAFLKEFSAYVKSVKPDAALVGEAWTETPIIAKYYDDLQMAFDFPLAGRIISGVKAGDGARIAKKIVEVHAAYPKGATDVPFLTNHDQRRVASLLDGDDASLRLAASVLLTLPGAPFLYYGEELGMKNGTADNDEAKRTPMPWDGTPSGGFTTGKPWFGFAPGHEQANVAAEVADPHSLLAHYRELIKARHASAALQRGELQLLSAPEPVLAFVSSVAGDKVLVVHNLGAGPQKLQLPVPAAATTPVFADPGASAETSGGGVNVSLPARSSGVFRIR